MSLPYGYTTTGLGEVVSTLDSIESLMDELCALPRFRAEALENEAVEGIGAARNASEAWAALNRAVRLFADDAVCNEESRQFHRGLMPSERSAIESLLDQYRKQTK